MRGFSHMLVARMRWTVLLALAAFGCAPRTPHVPPRDEARAADYAARADRAFAAGERELAFRLATHALVARLAACDGDCPEVARSYVQLGDLRCENGQSGWGVQSYRSAVEVLTRAGGSADAIRSVQARIDRCRRSAKKP